MQLKDIFGLTCKPQNSLSARKLSGCARTWEAPTCFGRPRTSSKEIAVTESQKMKITRRAYELWQQAGEPKGRDEEFYLQAERELNDAPVNAVTETMPPTPSRGRL